LRTATIPNSKARRWLKLDFTFGAFFIFWQERSWLAMKVLASLAVSYG
jgi:hypothetical protein